MLKLENINKKLGDFRLSEVNLNIADGEYFVLLGRSGSGKTQLLELIAGLNDPDTGEIWVDNINVTRKKIQDRRVGLVFQDYAIFPNMTVYGNIAYSMKVRKHGRDEISREVEKVAIELNINHLLNRFTTNLSGGELQRVALARTLITAPRLLLLDEPMASIDASLKDDIKRTLRQLNRKGLTIVHVTHDYREAISLASRVGVIHNGRIIQEGIPSEVFRNPVNKFVARYAGIRNFFRVRFYNENGQWKAACNDNLVFKIAEGTYPSEGFLLLRSEDIKISDIQPSTNQVNCFRGIINEILPSEYGMELTVDAGEAFYVDISSETFRELQLKESSAIWMTFTQESGIALA